MPQARPVREAARHRALHAQVRLVASWPHVRILCRRDVYIVATGANRYPAYSRENFDEYTRRQYNAKAPHLRNPFGYDEEPNKFNDFDIFTKLRVLHQLSLWTFWNPDRMREKMPEQREIDQTQWVSLFHHLGASI